MLRFERISSSLFHCFDFLSIRRLNYFSGVMVVGWIVILQIPERLLRLNLLLFRTWQTIAPSVCAGLATFQSSKVDQSCSQSLCHLLIWSLWFFDRSIHDCKRYQERMLPVQPISYGNCSRDGCKSRNWTGVLPTIECPWWPRYCCLS